MDLVLKALSQAPLVAIIAYIWWTARKDALNEIVRLQERIKEKDKQLGEFANTFQRLTIALELIKERLR